MARLRVAAAVVFLLTPLVAGRSSAQVIDVKEHVLKNGMKVLLQEDHTVPSACFYIFFRVGNRNERPGITGISHLFEHMMFNGSAKYRPTQFDRIIEEGGGYSNGSTWNDFTNYWEEFNSDVLEKVFDLESDRMRALRLDTANLEQERGIVKEERRVSVDNNVQNKMEEELYAAAYVAHMYHHPVVGWMGDLDNITLQDAREYFRTYYAPNNATVILTGDFDTEEAVKRIEAYFEEIPAQAPPRGVNNAEPQQLGERRVEVHKIAQLPAVMFGYKAVAVSDQDFYPLDVLATILSRGQSSRLYRTLVYEKQMASQVFASMDERVDPGLFTFYVQMKPGKTTAEAEKEIYGMLEDIKATGVSAEELQKAKNTAQADYVRRFKTNQGRGFIIGYYEIVYGHYKKAFDVVTKYEEVTNADIQRVAKKYFDPRQRTVVTLIPETQQTPETSSR
jgi:zinc protease